MELSRIEKGTEADQWAPEGGKPSSEMTEGLLDAGCPDYLEDGSLRENVSEQPLRPKDLDSFFAKLYEYFRERGFTCIVMTRVLNVVALCFVVFFSTFLLAFVDWSAVMACDSPDCDSSLLTKAHPFTGVWHGDLYGLLVLGFSIAGSMYVVLDLCRCVSEIWEFYEIKRFVNKKLDVSEREMCTILWPELVDKILKSQKEGALIVTHPLTYLDIVNRIMRKENYFLAMINLGKIDFSMQQCWVGSLLCPAQQIILGDECKYKGDAFHGEGVPQALTSGRNRILTKTMDWNLRFFLLNHIFDPISFKVNNSFNNVEALQRRFIYMGIINLILSPFVFMFMILYFLFKHVQEMQKNPTTVGTRTWSQLARWEIREFNELEHFFDYRINSSLPTANEFCQQFPSNVVSIVMKFIVFVCGAIASVLIVLSVYDESTLLYVKVFDRNLLFYIAFFGMAITVARPFVVEKNAVFNPAEVYKKMLVYTHFLPTHWIGKEHTYDVYDEFQIMFPYKIAEFAYELLAVFVVPLWMIFSMPRQAQRVVEFVREFTETVDGLGDVCCFATFDFERHGNSDYGAHLRRVKQFQSKQGKMEKSFVTFTVNNPNWEPSEDGKNLLKKLKAQENVSFKESRAERDEEKQSERSLHSSMEDLYLRNLLEGASHNEPV